MTAVLVTLASVVGVLLVLVALVRSPRRPQGEHASATLSHPSVLVFLTSTCAACGDLWARLGSGRLDLPTSARVVVVTNSAESEDRSRVERLAPDGVDVVMSSELWHRFHVAMAPYVVCTTTSGSVAAEGSVAVWDDIVAITRAGAEVS